MGMVGVVVVTHTLLERSQGDSPGWQVLVLRPAKVSVGVEKLIELSAPVKLSVEPLQKSHAPTTAASLGTFVSVAELSGNNAKLMDPLPTIKEEPVVLAEPFTS